MKPPRLWLGNLLAFGILCGLVLIGFSYQTRQAQQAFLDNAASHARLLADAVGLHARGAVLGSTLTDAMLISFLGSSARFVDYLDRVEPFRDTELAAFATEAGLAAIRIIRPEGSNQGPPDWNPGELPDCGSLNRLLPLNKVHALVFAAPRQNREGCIVVVMDSRAIEQLRDAIGLPKVLEAVAALPGVVRVALTGELAESPLDPARPAVPIVSIRGIPGGGRVVEARVSLASAELVVDLDAGPLTQTEQRLWRGFAGFAAILGLVGGLGTWLLYRYQQGHLEQLQAYEQRLSQQREEAALGQAAAAIAHELRNPLNAMAMGLQRLQMEADELSSEHRRLVAVVLEAVGRSNRSVSGLLDYARRYRPRLEPVALSQLVNDQLTLYAGSLQASGIQLRHDLALPDRVPGDPDLLRQVLDNLLKNALEAQPNGGYLNIRLVPAADGVELTLTNAGFTLPPEQAPRILEPWFSTKPGGAGLGLAISRRIITAHGGRLTVATPRPGELELRLFLPNRT
ncbi:MAG: two-component sensor histidine kinase [Candidatus Contendobacter sp.]|nr:two-component sensor histidine kinase [Candidatus Contendobacter sp.]